MLQNLFYRFDRRTTMFRFLYTSLVMACMVLMFAGFTAQKKLSLTGAWSVVEVRTVKSDGTYTAVFPRESQVLFADNQYSLSWTSHIPANRSWQQPDSAKLARMNLSIVNAGTYALRNSILTTKASFAMNPMFVNGIATFNCTMHGDTLLLKGLTVMSSDSIIHPLYANGSHVVTKLIRRHSDY